MEYKLLKWKSTDYPTLEITTSVPRNGCVVDCLFCPQKTLQEKYHGERFLSLDNFKKILDKIPIEIRIAFSGFTEPWMNKECTDMILYAHERGHSISVFTTGVGMKISDLERIKHIPFSDGPNGGFVFHLPDNELFAKHPITDRYVELVEYLGTLRNNIKNFYIMTMGTVHGSVKHVFDGIPTSEMWSRAGNLIHESVLNPELLNFKDNFKTIYHGEQNMTCNCMEGLYHNVLLPNGDVSLCCMDYGLNHILGNLFTQTYNEVIPLPMSCFNLCRFCENGTKPQ